MTPFEQGCNLQPAAGMSQEERASLLHAFEVAGLPIRCESPLHVQAIEPHVLGNASDHTPGQSSARFGLRVRRVASNASNAHPMLDWAREVTVDLAAWMLASPPPDGTVVDVVVPTAPHTGVPRLGRTLNDNRRITIFVRNRVAAGCDSQWARQLIDVMSERWSAGAPRCACC